MATLNHEGTISTFYGTVALRQAHAAAVSGDVITLSSGTFLSTDITKAVTIRGAGMDVTKAYDIVSEPTVLGGDFNIKIPKEDTGRLTLEGIYHNNNIYFYGGQVKNALFLKSRFKYISDSNSPKVQDLTVLNCRISDRIDVGSGNSAQFLNSVVNDFGYDSGYMSFSHCVILNSNGLSNSGNEYKNCIITHKIGNDYGVSSSSSAYNNLFISDKTDKLNQVPNNTNLRVPTSDERFAYLRGYNDSKDYKLTDQNRDVLKATDGGEIGIYGGSLPYSAVPTNPQITKFNVASKTTADGKLSVDIEVKSGE